MNRIRLRHPVTPPPPTDIMPAMPLNARVAIYFDEDGYVETSDRKVNKDVVGGPMGRHVAGKEFLNAYMRLGRANEFYALARTPANGNLLVELCHRARMDLPTKGLYVILEKAFHDVVFRQCPVTTIHYPAPLEPRLAWARQFDGRQGYALSGITHTICTVAATRGMTQFITAPFEPFDRMICISKAAVATVKSVTGAYCDYLADRFGGKPEMRFKLEQIPLGVDIAKFRPPTDEERSAQRARWNIAPDEVVVLYLGRLLHYGKVNPFPILHGLAAAARSTGKKVRLILAGWTPTQPVENAFRQGATDFGKGINVTFMDGTNAEVREKVWWVSDIFSFPTDNLQETFPQSVVEAMACGLPVVAAKWDGCKDQVIDGETGYLIPTYLVQGGTIDTTSKLIVGEYTYPHFMARCSQAAVVDLKAAASAFEKLILDADLRQRMGAAGRKRAEEEYAWEHIIRRYEEMWEDQDRERQAWIREHQTARKPSWPVPACYPPPEQSFAEYPTRFIDPSEQVRTAPEALERLQVLHKHPLTEYGAQWRADNLAQLQVVLDAARDGAKIQMLVKKLTDLKNSRSRSLAAVTWMMKYGLLELV